MNRVHFTNDGIYGRLGEELNEETFLRIADAIAALWEQQSAEFNLQDHRRIYVGYDTRELAEPIAEQVATQLAGHGFDVVLSDAYLPMPALNYVTRHDGKTIGAVMITGDHRAAAVLGIRLRDAYGAAPHPALMDAVEDCIEPVAQKVQGTYRRENLAAPFFEWLPSIVDEARVRSAKLTCVLDPMHATSCRYAADLLRGLCVDVVEIHGEPTPDFGGIHPEVVEPWIDDCEYATGQIKAHVGISIDGPSNRIAAMCEDGTYVPISKLYALIMRHLVERRDLYGIIAVPQETSAIVRREAQALSLSVDTVTKDESWARKEILEMSPAYDEVSHQQIPVLMGGDGVGSIVVPAFDPERDAYVVLLLLLEILATEQRSMTSLIAELDASLGQSVHGYRDVRMETGRFEMFKNLIPGVSAQGAFPEDPVYVSHADGAHLVFADDSWVLLRPSKTEPLVHIFTEAPTKEARNTLLEDAAKLIDLVFEGL